MKIEAREGDDGRFDLLVEFDVGTGSGIVDVGKLDEHDVQLLERSIPATRLKVNEADFFLKMMKRFYRHEAVTHYHFNAFVTALDGVLDILPQEVDKAREQEFRRWMEAKERGLKRNPDVELLLKFRNRSVHQGGHPPHLSFGVAIREHHDGERTAEPVVDLLGLGGKTIDDPLDACQRGLDAIRAVVDEAERRGLLKKKQRSGHTMQIQLWKETTPGHWRGASPEEMDTFGRKKPQIGVGKGTVVWPDGRTESVPPPLLKNDSLD